MVVRHEDSGESTSTSQLQTENSFLLIRNLALCYVNERDDRKKTLDKVISRHPHGLEIFVTSTRKSSLRRVFLWGIHGHPGVFLGHP